jgi:Flagellar assembly protein FliH
MLRSLQPEIARLALKVAERIMSSALTTDPEAVNGLIATALERVKEREHIRLLVHADDLAVVRANREVFVKLLEGQKSFDIVSDPRVDRGGCLIESNQGNVDARIQTQLGALRLAFEEIERREREDIERLARVASEQALAELEAQAPRMGYVQPPPLPPDPGAGEMLEAPLHTDAGGLMPPGPP